MRIEAAAFWGALLFLGACAKAPVEESFQPLVLTASLEGDAAVKTTLDGTDHKTVRWSAGDQVAAFVSDVKHTSSSMVILDGTNSKSASFTFSDLAADAEVSYAVYPASAAVERYGESVTIEVPTVQTAVAEGFDPNAAVTVAKGGESPVIFKNVCAYLAFTIKGEDAASVSSVRILADQPMTGTADVYWTEGNPTVDFSRSISAYTGVELKGPFESGKTYYVAVYPNNYTGLTFKLTHTTGYVSTYTSSTGLDVARKDNKVVAKNMALRTPAGWFEKDPAFIASGTSVIIAGKVNGVFKAIDNTISDDGNTPPKYTDQRSGAGSVSVSGSTLTPQDNYKWMVTFDAGHNFTLHPAGKEAYIYFANTYSEAGQNGLWYGDEYPSYYSRINYTTDNLGHIMTNDAYTTRYLGFKDGVNSNCWYGESFPEFRLDAGKFPAAICSFYVQVP